MVDHLAWASLSAADGGLADRRGRDRSCPFRRYHALRRGGVGRVIAEYHALARRAGLLFGQWQHSGRSGARKWRTSIGAIKMSPNGRGLSASNMLTMGTPSARWRSAAIRCFSGASSRCSSMRHSCHSTKIVWTLTCVLTVTRWPPSSWNRSCREPAACACTVPRNCERSVATTQKHGVLFIADEVMTGGGRLGPLSGAPGGKHRAGPDLRGKNVGGWHIIAGRDPGGAACRRCVGHRRPRPNLFPWALVYRPSAGMRGRGRQLEDVDSRAVGGTGRHGGLLARFVAELAKRRCASKKCVPVVPSSRWS